MRVLFVFALAAASMACSAHAPLGPRWPEPVRRDKDGGESLAPHAAARAIAAVADDDRPVERAAPAPSSPPAPPSTGAPATGAVTASEESLPLEEIVIEVEE